MEYISVENFCSLLDKIKENVRYIYIESDIRDHTHLVNWYNYPDITVLQVGWDEVIDCLKSFGFSKTYKYKHLGFFSSDRVYTWG